MKPSFISQTELQRLASQSSQNSRPNSTNSINSASSNSSPGKNGWNGSIGVAGIKSLRGIFGAKANGDSHRKVREKSLDYVLPEPSDTESGSPLIGALSEDAPVSPLGGKYNEKFNESFDKFKSVSYSFQNDSDLPRRRAQEPPPRIGLDPPPSRERTRTTSAPKRAESNSPAPLSDLDEFGVTPLPQKYSPTNLSPQIRPFSPPTVCQTPPLRSVSGSLIKNLSLSRAASIGSISSTKSLSSSRNISKSKTQGDLMGLGVEGRKLQLQQSSEKLARKETIQTIPSHSNVQKLQESFNSDASDHSPSPSHRSRQQTSPEFITRHDSPGFIRMISEPESTESTATESDLLPKEDHPLPRIPTSSSPPPLTAINPARVRELSNMTANTFNQGEEDRSPSRVSNFTFNSTPGSPNLSYQPNSTNQTEKRQPIHIAGSAHHRYSVTGSYLSATEGAKVAEISSGGANGSRLLETGLLDDGTLHSDLASLSASSHSSHPSETSETNSNPRPSKRWSSSNGELERAYSSIKGMLEPTTRSSNSTSQPDQSEKSLEKGLINSRVQPPIKVFDSIPTETLKPLPAQPVSKRLFSPSSSTRPRELSEDTFILRSDSTPGVEADVKIASPTPVISTLRNGINGKDIFSVDSPVRDGLGVSTTSEGVSVAGGTTLSRSRTNESTDDGVDGWTWTSARSMISSQPSLDIPLRSEAGREWIKSQESQRRTENRNGLLDDDTFGSLSSPSIFGCLPSEELQKGGRGNRSSSSQTWYSHSDNPENRSSKRILLTPISSRRGGGKKSDSASSGFTMAAIRKMEPIEIFLLISGVTASLEKAKVDRRTAEDEREAIMDELLESRVTVSQLQQLVAPDVEIEMQRLEAGRKVLELKLGQALLDLEASREVGDSLMKRSIRMEEEIEQKRGDWHARSTPRVERTTLIPSRTNSPRIRTDNGSPTRSREKDRSKFTPSKSKFSSRSTATNGTNSPKQTRPINHSRKSSTFSTNSEQFPPMEYNEAILRTVDEQWSSREMGVMPELSLSEQASLKHLDS